VQLCVALSARYDEHRSFEKGYAPTPFMVLAIASAILLELAVIYIPLLSNAFGTMPLGMKDISVISLTTLAAFAGIELRKFVIRKIK
jgi:magnesium-transporting ATPase (P-type)